MTGENHTEKTVLIIDDEMEMRFYLMAMVKSLGFKSVLTKNGVQGLETLNDSFGHLPDLIILDIMMPEKGGALVFQELKAHTRYRNIPLLIFSGVDPKAFVHYVKMLNIHPSVETPMPKYYVEKSADPDYLKQMILNCMNERP